MVSGVYTRTKETREKLKKASYKSRSGKNAYQWIERKERFCFCGCGESFVCKGNSNRKYINGHAARNRKHSKDSIEKMKQAKLGKKRGSYIEQYGEIKSEEIRKKQSISNKGKNKTQVEVRICIQCHQEYEVKITSKKKICSQQCYTDYKKGKPKPAFTKKHKQNMRIGAINRIKKNKGQCLPNYNPKACKFFKSYDKKHNTSGLHAENGGEFYIKELGYYPDYINFEKKIIMEYDEKYHEKQKEKDLDRQKQIQELYPDFEFVRIKQ